MLKKSIAIVFVLFLAVAMVCAAAEEKNSDETVTCPVSGETIKKSEAKVSFAYEGETYYFCCDNCKAAFMKDPEKYINKKDQSMHECCAQHSQEGKAEYNEGSEQAARSVEEMVVDPVCGMEFKKEKAKATHDYKGKTYYFCSANCKDKFVKNPDQYVRVDDTVVTCPVSGKSFKKSETTEFIEYEGKTYYFCCAGCKAQFTKNPEKYTKD